MATKARSKKSNKVTIDVEALESENFELKKELQALRSTKQTKTRHFWRKFGAAFFAILAVVSFSLLNISYWSSSTVVNTDKFVATMQPLIKDPSVQQAIQTQVTNEIFKQVNIEAELKKALPENLQFIAAPFASQVKSFTYNKIGDVLNSDKAYTIWTQTLQTGHKTIITYIENPNNDGVLTVNEVYDLASKQLKNTDIGFLFNKQLPSSISTIKLAQVKGVPEARKAINLLQNFTVLLAVISVAATALAIALSMRRRVIIIAMAIATFISMVLTYAVYVVSRNTIAEQALPAYSAASKAVVTIITEPLVEQTAGVAALILAALLVATVTSHAKPLAYIRAIVRRAFDAMFRAVLGSWSGNQYITWVGVNRVVISWMLIGVGFVAFALRLPPHAQDVSNALIFSALAIFVVELIASIARITKK